MKFFGGAISFRRISENRSAAVEFPFVAPVVISNCSPIHTIRFANSGGAMEALPKDVASGPESPFYHCAPDAAALSRVFREVASNLSELQPSK